MLGNALTLEPRKCDSRFLYNCQGWPRKSCGLPCQKRHVVNLSDYIVRPSKSDQYQISPAPSPEISHHTIWRTWLFIAYSDERWTSCQILTALLIHFSLKGWDNVLFKLGSERVKLRTRAMTICTDEDQRQKCQLSSSWLTDHLLVDVLVTFSWPFSL